MGATVIAVGSQKGGAGKTSVATNLAGAFAEEGRRVLVVDLDPMGGATHAFGVGYTSNEFVEVDGVYEALRGDVLPARVVVSEGLPENIHVLASCRALQQVSDHLYDPPRALRPVLSAVSGSYDVILIDTQPTASQLTAMALLAMDEFLVVSVPEPLPEAAVRHTLRDFLVARDAVAAEGLPPPHLLGLLATRVDRRRKDHVPHVAVLHELEGAFTNVVIHETSAIANAQGAFTTLLHHQPKHPVAGEFRRLRQEIEDRLKTRETS